MVDSQSRTFKYLLEKNYIKNDSFVIPTELNLTLHN